MLRGGHASHLYDLKLQERYQGRFNIKIRDGALPYNHPAYQLLIFLPLARLDYPTAFLIWGAMNCFFAIGISKLLRPYIDRENRGLCAALWLAFFPIAAALWQGQDSILTALLFAASFVSLKRGREGLAGCLIALGLYMPHLLIPLATMFIFTRQWRAVLGFAVTDAAKKLGYKEIVDLAAMGLEFPFVDIVAKKSYIKDNMDTLQRFVRAYTEAIAIYKNNRELAGKITSKYTGINDPAIVASMVDF